MIGTALRRTRTAGFTVTLLDHRTAIGSVASMTSVSLSPPSGCLLVVLCSCAGDESASAMGVSSTSLSNVGSWTHIRKYSGAASIGTIAASYALVTGSPGAGTVSVTFNVAHSRGKLQVIAVTGINTGSPVVQSKSAALGDTQLLSVTLDSMPSASSLLMGGGLADINSANDPGTGFTLISSDTVGGVNQMSEYKVSPTTGVIDTTATADDKAIIGLEIASA